MEFTKEFRRLREIELTSPNIRNNNMGFKLKPKHLKGAYKVARKAAPIALTIAETAFPGAKPVRTASKIIKVFF